jgi:hypothetical protein
MKFSANEGHLVYPHHQKIVWFERIQKFGEIDSNTIMDRIEKQK